MELAQESGFDLFDLGIRGVLAFSKGSDVGRHGIQTFVQAASIPAKLKSGRSSHQAENIPSIRAQKHFVASRTSLYDFTSMSTTESLLPAVTFWRRRRLPWRCPAFRRSRAGLVKCRLKAGIVGCGGRGTQAVANMLTGNDNVDLVAMADIFEDALEGSLNKLRDNTAQVRATSDAGITVERNGKTGAAGAPRELVAVRAAGASRSIPNIIS